MRESIAGLTLVSVLIGCGRIGFGPAVGEASNSDASSDIAADGGSLGAFGPAAVVTELDTGNVDDDPTLTADELEIYWNAAGEIWRANRSAKGLAFGAPALATELNSTSGESTPEITSDGLVIYFQSDRGGNADVWRAARSSRAMLFGTPARVPELSTAGVDNSPTPAPDDLSLILDRTGDLFGSTRVDTAIPWPSPAVIAELSVAGANDTGAHVEASGLAVVFASDRPGVGASGYHLWMATRSDRASAWTAPAHVAELVSVDRKATLGCLLMVALCTSRRAATSTSRLDNQCEPGPRHAICATDVYVFVAFRDRSGHTTENNTEGFGPCGHISSCRIHHEDGRADSLGSLLA